MTFNGVRSTGGTRAPIGRCGFSVVPVVCPTNGRERARFRRTSRLGTYVARFLRGAVKCIPTPRVIVSCPGFGSLQNLFCRCVPRRAAGNIVLGSVVFRISVLFHLLGFTRWYLWLNMTFHVSERPIPLREGDLVNVAGGLSRAKMFVKGVKAILHRMFHREFLRRTIMTLLSSCALPALAPTRRGMGSGPRGERRGRSRCPDRDLSEVPVIGGSGSGHASGNSRVRCVGDRDYCLARCVIPVGREGLLLCETARRRVWDGLSSGRGDPNSGSSSRRQSFAVLCLL